MNIERDYKAELKTAHSECYRLEKELNQFRRTEPLKRKELKMLRGRRNILESSLDMARQSFVKIATKTTDPDIITIAVRAERGIIRRVPLVREYLKLCKTVDDLSEALARAVLKIDLLEKK